MSSGRIGRRFTTKPRRARRDPARTLEIAPLLIIFVSFVALWLKLEIERCTPCPAENEGGSRRGAPAWAPWRQATRLSGATTWGRPYAEESNLSDAPHVQRESSKGRRRPLMGCPLCETRKQPYGDCVEAVPLLWYAGRAWFRCHDQRRSSWTDTRCQRTAGKGTRWCAGTLPPPPQLLREAWNIIRTS